MSDIWEQIPNSNNTCLHFTAERVLIGPVRCQDNLLTQISTPTPLTITVNAPVTGPVTTSASGKTEPSTPASAGPKPTAPGSNKDGLQGGAVAGIAVGMLIAGILVAGAVFFLLLRRQKRRQASAYQTHYVPQTGYTSSQEKGPTAVTGAVASSVDHLLPQPVADDTITNEVSQIRDKIKNHVRTYYHSEPVSTARLNEVGLRDLATAMGVSTSVIISALANPASRQDALRLIVGWVILSRSTGERNASLLPPDVAGLAASLSGKKESNTSEYCSSLTGMSSESNSDRSSIDFVQQMEDNHCRLTTGPFGKGCARSWALSSFRKHNHRAGFTSSIVCARKRRWWSAPQEPGNDLDSIRKFCFPLVLSAWIFPLYFFKCTGWLDHVSSLDSNDW